MKAYNKIYWQRPEVKMRRKARYYSAEAIKARKIYNSSPKRIASKRALDKSPRGVAYQAKSKLNNFLKTAGIENLKQIGNVTNQVLINIARGNGYPDFPKEFLEEKGPKCDWLHASQWARAILEYRAGRRYRVAWRFTSTKRCVFSDVFKFYEWQQKLGKRT